MINDRDFVKITRGKIYKDDYIKRKDVIALAWNAIYEDEWHMHRLDKVVSVSDIAKLPSADVRPVVRGKWSRIDYEPLGHDYICSACGWKNDMATHFCPNCGARLDGEEK